MANWWDDSPVVSQTAPAGRPAFDRKAALAETDKLLNLPAGFSAAQIQVESGGNPKARSPAGAMGLAQVMPATLASLSKRLGRNLNPDDEQDAVAIHREVMRENLAKFKDPSKALMAYNGGWDPAKWSNPETSAYVGKVSTAMKGQQNPAMAAAGKAVNAVMPSAQAATPAAPAGDQWWANSPLATAEPAAAPEAKEPGMLSSIGQGVGNLAAGAVRGAGSIGATVMRVLPNALGGDTAQENAARRQSMDDGLQSMGAQPDSWMYKGGKLAGEIAGTAGAGGAAANVVARVPGLAAAAPNLLASIATGGFRAGTATGAANVAMRAAGGAVTGGLAAGMINPEDAGAGAVIGGALPPALMAAGGVGRAIGGALRGPAASPELLAAAQQARSAGYVMPPTQVAPTLTNRLLEGFSGKITTGQNASARNQVVTNRLAATTLGLPGDVPITPDALNAVRRQAGQAYDAIGGTGIITPGQSYTQALDRIVAPYRQAAQGFPNAAPSPAIEAINSLRSPSFDASSAVAQLRNVREMADTAFAQGNRGVGRSLRDGAEALETAMEEHLRQTGQPQLLNEFQDARRLIAQTYSIEKALNPVTGTVDARKLAAQVAKGRPMTGPMRDAAEFAARFPKAAQPIEGMGSLPQTSPLDWFSAAAMSAATANPLMMAGVVARPMARAAALSGLVQNRLAQGPNQNTLAQLLQNSGAGQLPYRVAPVALTDR